MPAILFGKLPAHGDFVARGLSAGERDAFDRWLSAELAGARDALGDAFDPCFEAAPPWRFAWEEDAGLWTAGALAPSVDAAGRRFPLLLARTSLRPGQADGMAGACEDLIYAALAEAWDADKVTEMAERAAFGEGGEAPHEGWWLAGDDGAPLARLPGRRPPGLLVAMLAAPVAAA